MKLQILAAMSAVYLLRVMSIARPSAVIATNVKIVLKAFTIIYTFAVIAWANGLKLMASLR